MPDIPPDWLSLMELDRLAGQTKGSAFRAFRTHATQWPEGEHHLVLSAQRDADAIDRLRTQGRIYAGTVNLVMVSPALARAILAQLDQTRRISTQPAE